MTESSTTRKQKQYRYYVRSPDGRAIYGFDDLDGARTAALAYGEGAHIIDTLAQAYVPMLHEVMGGEIVYAGYGGWDTGRFGVDRDLIEAIKKGHVALVHAFLAKGADANARDRNGGPALHWAVGGGKPDIVALLLAHGADVGARDHNGLLAREIAKRRGRDEIVALLENAQKSEASARRG